MDGPSIEQLEKIHSTHDPRERLHLIRTTIASLPQGLDAWTIETEDGRPTMSLSWEGLYLRAMEANTSLVLGQQSDSNLFLFAFEQLNGTKEAANSLVEHEIATLRHNLALKSQRFQDAAAWALNIVQQGAHRGQDAERLMERRSLSLARLAHAASSIGLANSAAQIYSMARLAADLPGHRALVSSFEAPFRFNRGEVESALTLYLEAYENGHEDDLTPEMFQWGNSSGIADCYRLLGDQSQAWRYTLLSLGHLDAARSYGYDSIGGIESAFPAKTRWSSRSIYHQAATGATEEITLALGLMSNNSMAAALRSRNTDSPLIKFSGTESAAADLALKWSRFSEDDVQSTLSSKVPTVAIDFFRDTDGDLRGTSLVICPGEPPATQTWELSQAEDQFVDGLLRPPSDDLFDLWISPWIATADHPVLASLTVKLLPAGLLDAIRRGEIDRLHFHPLFNAWTFPFTALALDGKPLGSLVAVSASTMAARPVSPARPMVWAAHFDTNLPFVAEDMKTFQESAALSGAEILPLLENAGDKPSLVAFGGHGYPLGLVVDSRGKLETANLFTTHSFPEFETGALIFLNSCWAGRTIESLGQDNVSFALSLLERGAHTVISTIGPVRDDVASNFFRDFLAYLPGAASTPHSVQKAIAATLARNPLAPLCDWAVYACLSVPD